MLTEFSLCSGCIEKPVGTMGAKAYRGFPPATFTTDNCQGTIHQDSECPAQNASMLT